MSFRIKKLLVLPDPLEPNVLYITPMSGEDKVVLTFTDGTGIPFESKSGISPAEADILLDSKVDKETGKVLSSNDFTTALKDKLESIEDGATKNDTDESLRQRSTHTGRQLISSVAFLESELSKKVARRIAYVCKNDDDLMSMFYDRTSMFEDFQNWHRFKVNQTGNLPPPPADYWRLQPYIETPTYYETDTYVPPNEYNGVYSNQLFEEYDMTFQLKISSSVSPDAMGLIVASHTDAVTGNVDTLSVVRSSGRYGRLWCVVYNMHQGEERGEKVILDNSKVFKYYGTDVYGDVPVEDSGFDQLEQPWRSSSYPITVRVVRVGDLFQCWSSEFEPVYANGRIYPESSMLIDLSSDPLLEKFKGPAPFGFCFINSPEAEFAPRGCYHGDYIGYDVRTKECYKFDGVAWDYDETFSEKFFEPGVIISDLLSPASYFTALGTSFYQLPMTAV